MILVKGKLALIKYKTGNSIHKRHYNDFPDFGNLPETERMYMLEVTEGNAKYQVDYPLFAKISGSWISDVGSDQNVNFSGLKSKKS
jgi:hypothetical protein